jgi:zinc protease
MRSPALPPPETASHFPDSMPLQPFAPPALSTPTSTEALPDLPAPAAKCRRLANGLEVLLREDPEHPLVSVQAWVRAGSIHEEDWTGAGLAHCVEHMLFKGTANRGPDEITRQIQARGGQVNAYTSYNRTVYWIDGLAEQADGYLEILADLLMNPRLDADDLRREQDVIRREMAMDHDDPDSTLHHLMQAIAFRKHPLRHPIIGHRPVFDRLGQPDVAGFVGRHYAPNNVFLVITGAFDSRRLMRAVEKAFGGWERRRYEPVLLPEEPPLRGRREEFTEFATDLTRLSLGWQVPGEAHPDKAALDVAGFLLGGGRSSRLYQSLREQRSLAHDVWAGAWCVQECGLFQCEAECDPADADAVRDGLFEVVGKLEREGPDERELEKAVRATVNACLRSLVTTKGQAAGLGNSWLITGALDLQRQYLESVKALTPERIRDVTRLYLPPDNVCVAGVGPRPPSARARSRRKRAPGAAAELRKYDLDGLTLLVRRNPRLPLVSIRAQFLGSVLAEGARDAGVTLASSRLLLKGTHTRDAAEIQGALENRGGSLQCTADAHRRLLGAEIMRGDEGLALDLLADLMLHPELPEAGLASVKKKQLAQLREEQEDPLTVALRRARSEIFAGTPFARTALGTAESIAALDTAACRKSLRKTLTRGNGVLTIFGDVDPDSIAEKARQAFAQLPAGAPAFDPRAVRASKAKPGHWRLREDKEQAVLVAGFRTVDLHHPDSNALALIDEACSDMGSRFFSRIREELGLAYYVGAQAFSALSCGAFYFYLGTDPARIGEARAELLRLIGELAANGLEGDEIERAKTTWKSSWLRSQQGNGAMADITGWNHLCGLGADFYQKLPGIVNAITPAEIAACAARYLDPARAFLVELAR